MGRASASRKTTKPDTNRSQRSRTAPRPVAKPASKKRRAGGSSSKRTGSRYELEFIEELSKKGIDAQRVPLSGAAGGHFGSDVMVFPSPITTFSVEVKYRSNPTGMRGFLKAWAVLDHQPVCIGPYLVFCLDDFPKVLELPAQYGVLVLEPPALINKWMQQAQHTFGMLAIRLPKRELDCKWVVVIDASSEALLRQISWPSFAIPSGPTVTTR